MGSKTEINMERCDDAKLHGTIHIHMYVHNVHSM